MRRRRNPNGTDSICDLLFKPDSTWHPPTTFPDLSHAKRIGLDLETKDPHLLEKGPGTFRKDGHIAGVAIVTDDGFAGYYPVGHLGGGNMDKSVVFSWLRDQLKNPNQEKVGANIGYDVEWLRSEGVDIKGRLLDVLLAEPLIDEESDWGYTLEKVSNKYLGYGKEEDLLKEAISAYGLKGKGDLWKLPPQYVGNYAMIDANNPMDIIEIQEEILAKEDLTAIFDLETRLLPCMIDMRFQGVPVDLEKAAELSRQWKIREEQIRLEIKKLVGTDLDVWSGPVIAMHCDRLGIKYFHTDAGNPSFEGSFLKNSGVKLLKLIAEVRTLDRLRGTYVDELIFGNQINGRIHAQFNQLRKDDSGTRGGRFSSCHPNLQQVPARDEELAAYIRALFIPEVGKFWAKLDYSQQEPRILVHFAYLLGLPLAQEFKEAYDRDKSMDFYKFIVDAAGIKRRESKDLTLGRMYGMGPKKMAEKINKTVEETGPILRKFDEAAPFIKELSIICSRKAQERGWIRTLLGRKRHFNLWVPDIDWRDQKKLVPLPLDKANEAYPGMKLIRAFTYKALNALVQGSGGDMNKMAMLTFYEDYGVVPYLTVHDELDTPVSYEDEAYALQDAMESCCDVKVPMKVDLTIGDHWK